MRKFLMILLSVLCCNVSCAQPSKKYCNTRFDFCINCPASFISQPTPRNDDGLIFLSQDNNAEIRTFGSLAIGDFDKLQKEFTMASGDIQLTYKKFTKDWFVFSGVDKAGKIVFRKTVKKKINYMSDEGVAVFQTLMITYPASQNKLYAPYCSVIAKSL
jgi:hypothetical protein